MVDNGVRRLQTLFVASFCSMCLRLVDMEVVLWFVALDPLYSC